MTTTMIIYGLMALLFAYVIAEALWTFSAIDPRRRALGQPTIIDIIKASRRDLTISHYAEISRSTILQALNTSSPRDSLDRYIRQRFKDGTHFTDWSIDYVYAHRDHTGKRKPGGWPSHKEDYATVWFYNRPTPPVPAPKPEAKPVPRPQTVDEEAERIAAFLKHPTAFWLNPDWNKARETGQPFWMHEPAQIPSRYLPVPDKIERAAEIIADNDLGYGVLTLQKVMSDYEHTMIIMDDPNSYENYEIKLSAGEYRQAKRRAMEMAENWKWR